MSPQPQRYPQPRRYPQPQRYSRPLRYVTATVTPALVFATVRWPDFVPVTVTVIAFPASAAAPVAEAAS